MLVAGSYAVGYASLARPWLITVELALSIAILAFGARWSRSGWPEGIALFAIAAAFGPLTAILIELPLAFLRVDDRRAWRREGLTVALMALALILAPGPMSWIPAVAACVMRGIGDELESIDLIVVAALAALATAGGLAAGIALVGALVYLRAAAWDSRIASHDAELRDAFLGMLRRSHPYTRGHADRVGRMARSVGARFGFGPRRLDRLEYAAVLHDLGKVTIDEEILDLPRRLTVAEMEHVRDHAANGADILAPLSGHEVTSYWIRCHHERVDANGYPSGLGVDRSPIESRIIAVIDAFDAMIGGDSPEESRSYRRSMSVEQALAELDRCAGSQFDREVVSAFRGVVQEARS